MKNNRLKAKIIVITFIFLFIFFGLFYFKPRDYSKEYKINNFKIVEKYNVSNNYYNYVIINEKKIFVYKFNSNYKNKRNLIKNIKINKDKKSYCILPESDYLEFYPLCLNNKNELVTLNTVNNNISYEYKKIKSIRDTYKKIHINSIYNKSYLIYNYTGFEHISDEYNSIKLYEKDIYDNNFIFQFKENIIVPNIENNYFIKSFYLINGINGKKEEIKLNESITLNIRFLGAYKNSIYFIDEKEEKEYEINLRKKEILEISGKIFDGKKFVNYNVKTIKNKNLEFKKTNDFEYKIINNKIYQVIDKNKILLSNTKVDKIIKIEDYSVYYLSGDKLYVYNLYDGEIFLLEYFEWNFNNTNVIYIF